MMRIYFSHKKAQKTRKEFFLNAIRYLLNAIKSHRDYRDKREFRSQDTEDRIGTEKKQIVLNFEC